MFRIKLSDLADESGRFCCYLCGKQSESQESLEYLPDGWKVKAVQSSFWQTNIYYFCSTEHLEQFNLSDKQNGL